MCAPPTEGFRLLTFALLSADKWWRGTGPTASTWKKAPSPTYAPSSSATATASTVRSPPSRSPRPGKSTRASVTVRPVSHLQT